MDEPISPLMAEILEARARETQAAVNLVISGLKRERDRLLARLFLVESETHRILNRPWMPTPATIMKAVHPSNEAIDAVLAEWNRSDPDETLRTDGQ